MAEQRRVPIEIRAAQRAIGQQEPVEPGRGASGSAATMFSPIGPDLDDLLNEVLSADFVEIVGMLPLQCATRLIELEEQRKAAGEPYIRRLAVRYYTPARDTIAVYRHSGVLGTLVQRWVAGTTGLRNWLLPSGSGVEDERALSIFEFDDVYLDGLVHTIKDGFHNVTVISQLPALKKSVEAEEFEESTLIITRMPESQVAQFHEFMEGLVGQAVPLAPRKIRCRTDESAIGSRPTGQEVELTISRLGSYGSPRPHEVEPVVVVAICAPTGHGTSVLLKQRNRGNARDDFNTLSLISERVLVEDFPGVLAGQLDPDPHTALDELWMQAGQPAQFEVPEEAFRRAAQRELFITCGLDIEASRLKLHGTCLLEREGEETYLGFYIYRVDLTRSSPIDELNHAKRWNTDLVAVPLAELYRPATARRLNRLLRRRQDWLQANVFQQSPVSENA